MELSDKLVKCQQELVSYKVSQPVTTDSGILYRYDYNPGIFRSETGIARYHTLRCLTPVDLKYAVFITYPSHMISPQAYLSDTMGLSDEPNVIVWKQESIWDQIYQTDIRLFAPQYLGIFSNVPFEVQVVSVEERY